MQNCIICVDFALCARSLRDAKLCYKNANAGIVTDSASLYIVKFCSIIYAICVVYVNSVCYGICLSLTFRFVSYGRTV